MILEDLADVRKQHDYLMNAMLSIAAAHLSSMCPYDDRYRCASLSSLSQSVENFRQQLSMPITTENSDPLMGTAILIHYSKSPYALRR